MRYPLEEKGHPLIIKSFKQWNYTIEMGDSLNRGIIKQVGQFVFQFQLIVELA